MNNRDYAVKLGLDFQFLVFFKDKCFLREKNV